MKYFVFNGEVYKIKKSTYEYFGLTVATFILLFPSYFFGSSALDIISIKNSVTVFPIILLVIAIIPLFFGVFILTSEIYIDVNSQELVRTYLFGKIRSIVPLDSLEKITNVTKRVNGFYVGTYIKLSFNDVSFLNRSINVKHCFGDKVASQFLSELNIILSTR